MICKQRCYKFGLTSERRTNVLDTYLKRDYVLEITTT